MGCGWPPSRHRRGPLRRTAVAAICIAIALLALPASASALIPVNAVPPSIGGTAQEGHDLMCSNGVWLNNPTSYAYQWNRNGSPLVGETSSTHRVTPADVGQAITCSVTASNADGSSLLAATSLPVVPIAAVDTAKPVNLVPPIVTGTAQQGKDLQCSDGTWLNSPTSYARQWKRDGVAIAGATAATYTVTAADVGHQVACAIVASNAAGDSAAATSLPVVPIAAVDTGKPVNLTPPVLTGIAQEGKDLQCSEGTWLNSPTSYARQWKRDGVAIAGATGSTRTVAAADVGRQITCSVVATNSAGDSAETTSLPVVPIAAVDTAKPVALVPPSITGVAQQGRELTCSDGVWLNNPTSYSYGWKRDGVAIAGATGATRTVAAEDVGHQVSCGVTAHNAAGDSIETTSLPVVPIAGLAVNVTRPTLSGSGRVPDDLVCDPGTWQPAGDTYLYRWSRDGTPIAGAAGARYTVTFADVGKALVCTVTARTVAGETSAASEPVVGGWPAGWGQGAGEAPKPSGAAQAARDTTAPVIRTLSLLRSRFAVGRGTTALAAAARPRAGTTIRFVVSEPGLVTFAVARLTDGYRQGRRCVVVTARLRRTLALRIRGATPSIRAARLRRLLRARACRRSTVVGSFSRLARLGANAVPFTGRIGRRALPAGRYALAAVSIDAARNRSRIRTVGFQVVAAAKRKPARPRRR